MTLDLIYMVPPAGDPARVRVERRLGNWEHDAPRPPPFTNAEKKARQRAKRLGLDLSAIVREAA